MLCGRGNRFWVLFMVAVIGFFACSTSVAGEIDDSALSAALAQVELFDGLSDSEREALKSAATLRHMKAGDYLSRKGVVLNSMFIVLDGEADLFESGKLVTTLSGQFIIGETEFLGGFPAFVDVVLLRDTDIIELHNAPLTELMEKQPRVGFVLIRKIAEIEARRLRDTTTGGSARKGQ